MTEVMQSEPRREGFWQGPMDPDLPMPVTGVEWPSRIPFLLFLEAVEQRAERKNYRGFSQCRTCGKPNGSATLVLGGWQWPSGFMHYVRNHGVKPSDDFIAFIEAKFREFHESPERKAATEIPQPMAQQEDVITPETAGASMARIPKTDAETMTALRSDTPLNRARAAFSNAYGRIEQAHMQRKRPGPIESRRMEFEAVAAIAKALGVEIPTE